MPKLHIKEGLFGERKPADRIAALKKEVDELLKSFEAQKDINPAFRRGLLTIQQQIEDMLKITSSLPPTAAEPAPFGANNRGSYGEPLAETKESSLHRSRLNSLPGVKQRW